MATSRALTIHIIGDDRSLQAATARSQTAMGKFAGFAKKAAKVGAAGVIVGTALSVKAFADFDGAMTKSLAIMDDVTKKQRGKMVDAAREVGRTTSFSAKDAGEAYFFLASAGLDAAQSLAAMPRVAKFAQAGNFDLATATDLATDAQSALGLKAKDAAKNLHNLNRVQDVLVKANTLSNATVEQFSQSLTNKAGAAAKVLGKDVEETVAVLAAFADQGVKGELAGNALNIVWRDLQTAVLKNKTAFADLGVATFDANGEFRHTSDVIGDLEKSLKGMSDEEKKATLTKLGFQDRSQAFILTLLGTSGAIKEYDKANREAHGYTDKVARKQLKGLAGAFTLLKSQVADASLELGEALAPAVESVTNALRGFIEGIRTGTGAGGQFRATVEAMGAVLVPIGAALGGVALQLASTKAGVVVLSIAAAALVGRMVVLAGVWAVSKVAAFVTAIGAAITAVRTLSVSAFALRGALLSTGIGAVAVLAGTAIGALMAMKTATEKTISVFARSKQAMKGLRQSSADLKSQEESLRNAKGQVRAATSNLHTQEEKLKDLRDKDASKSAIFRQENALATARRRVAKATRNRREQEELLQFFEKNDRRSIGEIVHTASVAISTEKKRIAALRSRASVEGHTPEIVKKSNEAFRRLAAAEERRREGIHFAIRANKKWGGSLKDLTIKQHEFGTKGRTLKQLIREQREEVANLREGVRTGGGPYAKAGLGRAKAKLRDLRGELHEFNKETGKSEGKVERFKDQLSKLRDKSEGSREKIKGLREALVELPGRKKVKVDVKINIPGLRGPVGMGGPAGSGWPLEEHIDAKVGKRVQGFAARDPMGALGAAAGIGGLGGAGASGVDAFTPIAGRFGLEKTSGYRPGDDGYHGINRARDYSNSSGPTSQMLAFAKFMAAAFGSRLKELIYSGGLGYSIKDGVKVPPYAVSEHYNHVHVAMQQGGSVKVPGSGSGDKVPAVAPAGSFVLNKLANAAASFQSGGMVKLLLEPGERVFEPGAVARVGLGNLEALNSGVPRFPFQQGGRVGRRGAGLIQKLQSGGPVAAWDKLSGPSWDNDELATLAHVAGMSSPGRMAQKAQGESSGNRKAVGNDPGGTEGLGLWQITTGFNDDLIAKMGGRAAMFHPYLNARAAKEILDQQGMGAWYAPFVGPLGKVQASLAQRMHGIVGGKGDAGGKAETVPAIYKGARTKSLSFPSVPKNLPAVKREIQRWQREAHKYRTAAREAEKRGHPKVLLAIQANVKKIENHLRKLFDARHKLREAKARKALTGRLGKQLSKLTGYEELIALKERTFEQADQFAGQIVEQEPRQPRLPDNATEKQREEAEKAYVSTFQNYVDTRERPAYAGVLGTLADLRNTIIRGEQKATGLGLGWEGGARTARVEIESINRYTEAVSRRHAAWKRRPRKGKSKLPDRLRAELETSRSLRERLPSLRDRNRQFSDVLGEGRERFYGGAAWIGAAKNLSTPWQYKPGMGNVPGTMSPLRPPTPPMAGSGSFEESLIAVQGTHWPGQHSIINPLPATRQAGQFGGSIWTTQGAIEELGLKIADASSGSGGNGGGGGDEDDRKAELLALREQQLLQAREQIAGIETTKSVLAGFFNVGAKGQSDQIPWGGRYASGGTVRALVGETGPEIADLPVGTKVHNAKDSSAMLQPQVTINIYEDGREPEVFIDEQQMDAIVNRVTSVLGQRAHHRAATAGAGNIGTL